VSLIGKLVVRHPGVRVNKSSSRSLAQLRDQSLELRLHIGRIPMAQCRFLGHPHKHDRYLVAATTLQQLGHSRPGAWPDSVVPEKFRAGAFESFVKLRYHVSPRLGGTTPWERQPSAIIH